VNRKVPTGTFALRSSGSGAAPDGPTACSIRFDEGRRPISVYTFDGEVTAADVHTMLRHSEEILRRGRHALLMDMRRIGEMSARLRQQAAAWNVTNAAQLAERRVGLAMVITDGRERGIITAIYWHNPPPYPYLICERVTEALAWCAEKLAR
jgi:hypothetical protein